MMLESWRVLPNVGKLVGSRALRLKVFQIFMFMARIGRIEKCRKPRIGRVVEGKLRWR